MFKSKNGYFDTIECPNFSKYNTCDIVNCIFKHPDETSHKRVHDDDGAREDPQIKRQATIQREFKQQIEGKLKENVQVKKNEDNLNGQDTIENGRKLVANPQIDSLSADIPVILPKPVQLRIPRSDRVGYINQLKSLFPESATPNKDAISKEYELASEADSIEQYAMLVDRAFHKEEVKDPEFVLPRHIPVPPATIQVRKQNIMSLVKIIQQMQPNLSTPKLKAIEEEYKIAHITSKHTYQQSVRKKVYEMKNPAKFQNKKKEYTDEELYRELCALIISQDTLVKFGFIMDVPQPVAPNPKRICRRCGHEFKMEDQLLPIHCEYHSGKVSMNSKRAKVYNCCGAELGDNETEGCTSYNHHVFYWDGPGEMQAFLPFQKTNEIYKPHANAFKALGIDCEMGFTTKGFELLRVTAMDFFTGEEVLDVLVKPIGEVIDLNSRWSGISEIKEDALTFNESVSLLGEIMDPNTILIGHGLENDMNAMRLIHHRIVDTAILYPKFKTSPRYRYPLKTLTFKYLGRTIQTGEHDSGEDALAAIDIVKYFIKLPD